MLWIFHSCAGSPCLFAYLEYSILNGWHPFAGKISLGYSVKIVWHTIPSRLSSATVGPILRQVQRTSAAPRLLRAGPKPFSATVYEWWATVTRHFGMHWSGTPMSLSRPDGPISLVIFPLVVGSLYLPKTKFRHPKKNGSGFPYFSQPLLVPLFVPPATAPGSGTGTRPGHQPSPQMSAWRVWRYLGMMQYDLRRLGMTLRHPFSDKIDVVVEWTQTCVGLKNHFFQNTSDSNGCHVINSMP